MHFGRSRNIDIQDPLEARPFINAMPELGMRTRPAMTHGPALSDIPSLANAALQVRGKTNNWEFPVKTSVAMRWPGLDHGMASWRLWGGIARGGGADEDPSQFCRIAYLTHGSRG